MVLRPLEFRDCLTDSPWFRQNLHEHELALEHAYKAIKNLEQQCRELVTYAQKLSRTQRAFAQSLKEFKFENIGTTQTDEERVISGCLKEFSSFIHQVEDQRDRILVEAEKNYIEPLRSFRVNRIAAALQDEKKKFEKASVRFYSSLEKHLHMSTNRKGHDFKEADASLEMEQRAFYQASLDYVFVLQSVQERMKFEFIETLSSFLYSWLSFYHVGHMIHEDFKPYLDDVQTKVQKARDNFLATQQEAEELKAKMLHTSTAEHNGLKSSVKQGYLFFMEKKNLITVWTKYFCIYQKESGIFTMIPYSQINKQPDNRGTVSQSTSLKLVSCTRRASDSIDKRFCFDLTVDRSDEKLTFQALSEDDRRAWLSVMDGKEPVYSPSNPATPSFPTEVCLDKRGFAFFEKCIAAVDDRGLEEQGLYRNCGVSSKVQKMLQLGFDDAKAQKLDLNDENEWEMRTITSAIKMYLRNLSEPLMTFELHNKFINAAKIENKAERIEHVHYLVHQLPDSNYRLLQLLIQHLKRVADKNSVNLMTMANLGVCFGPTLLRPAEESLAAIMDIKFCNVVVEVLIRNYDKVFTTLPVGSMIPRPPKPAKSSSATAIGTTNDAQPPQQPSCSTSAGVSNGGAAFSVVTNNVVANNSESQSAHSPVHFVPRMSSAGAPRVVSTGVSTAASGGRPVSSQHSSHSSQSQAAVAWNPVYGSVRQRPHGGIYSSSDLFESSAHSLKANSSCDSLSSADVAHQPVGTAAVATVASSGGEGSSTTSPNLSQLSSRRSNDKITVSYAQPYTSDLIHKRLSTATGEHTLASSRRVRTLYECIAGHETELSFLPGQIITNVHESKEPGWLVGTLNGRTGLIPENYVEPLP